MRVSLAAVCFSFCLLFVFPSQAETASSHAAHELVFAKKVSQLGIFDASIAEGVMGQRLWMSYTAIDPSPRFPKDNDRIESTRLAYSDTAGQDWNDYGYIVNNIKEFEFNGMPASWVNETSSLVYDPTAPLPERWKLFWHHYLLIAEKPRFEHGWIAYKTASTPEGLKQAPEIKLFGASAYQTINDDPNGETNSPVGGEPMIPFHKLHDNLSYCAALGEPGAMALPSGLYLAAVCQKPNMLGDMGFHSETVLMKCAAPCHPTEPHAWVYIAKLLNDGLSAADLFSENGQSYLIASPSSDDPVPGAYNGCNIYHFTNLQTGELEKDKFNQPRVVKSFSGEPHSFNGACTYRASAPGAGVVLSQLHIVNDKPSFHIIVSGKGMGFPPVSSPK